MIKVIMHGCNGAMGQTITRLIAKDPQIEIAAGIDKYTGISNTYPVFTSLSECTEDADVIIDFSNASAVDDLLDFAESKKMPVVLCTTGLSQEQLDRMKKVSETTAILKSANMSLGVNLLMKLLKEAAPILAASAFDIEVVEKHHNQKVDAPSGTALALADAINEEFDGAYEYVYDRTVRREKRRSKEIGISAVRGGTIVGDHDVIFAGEDEVITFSHRAYSKAVFGNGAIAAARFLAGKGPGLYEMKDVVL